MLQDVVSGVSGALRKLVRSTGKAGWIAGTTFLILIVPLIIEMDREQQLVEFESQQLNALTGSQQAPANHSFVATAALEHAFCPRTFLCKSRSFGGRLQCPRARVDRSGSRPSPLSRGAMEKNPWYKNVEGPFLQWKGPVGIKEDGGGCTRGRGRVGPMAIHRAANNRDAQAIKKAVEEGHDVNEVEAAGNTPLHFACWQGWIEGCELLLSLGAKVNASNNAGDRPWHWARNAGHEDVMAFIEKDFYQKECWAHHPKPHQEYMDMRKKQDEALVAERAKLVPGM
ncbi:mitochondrial import receptor subunit TOM9-2-like [Chlorella sorokiniana]|uniref:Mitochondrial import receptor subunit TOM9-2-like n=1 Tax=Chlorella sorokiniana TaxID=3076 RepID=A0A2P6TDA3_CHLSO|nr:mitochondrial import receptor subunit TOM9-2-like [Chlorella sorokiniana]|eukprot:PRW20613.1 mitochondrial import receptor subunit TOM9-2-like [Chlorella sorokiniana]